MFKKRTDKNTTDDFNSNLMRGYISGKDRSSPKLTIDLSVLVKPLIGFASFLFIGYAIWAIMIFLSILPGSMPSWIPFAQRINAIKPLEKTAFQNSSDDVWSSSEIVETNTPVIKISLTPTITVSPTITLTPTITMTPTPLINLDNPTVRCNDDFLRYVEYQQGACSFHGGIKEVLQPIPVLPLKE